MRNTKREGKEGTTMGKAMARIIGGFVAKGGQFLSKEMEEQRICKNVIL